MAFELLRVTVYRLIGSISCKCQVMQEFSDNRYKEKIGEPSFSLCEKHGKDGGTFEFILGEYLETEIAKVQAVPPQNFRNAPEEVKDAEGNVIGTKIPNTGGSHRPQPKVSPASNRTLNRRQTPGIAVDGVEIGGNSIDAMIAQADGADPSEVDDSDPL